MWKNEEEEEGMLEMMEIRPSFLLSERKARDMLAILTSLWKQKKLNNTQRFS